MKTKYHIKFRDYFAISFYKNFKIKINYFLGKIINYLLQIHKEYMVVDMPHNTYRNSKEALKNMYEPKAKYNLSLECCGI